MRERISLASRDALKIQPPLRSIISFKNESDDLMSDAVSLSARNPFLNRCACGLTECAIPGDRNRKFPLLFPVELRGIDASDDFGAWSHGASDLSQLSIGHRDFPRFGAALEADSPHTIDVDQVFTQHHVSRAAAKCCGPRYSAGLRRSVPGLRRR
jgi:hypothetical protein